MQKKRTASVAWPCMMLLLAACTHIPAREVAVTPPAGLPALIAAADSLAAARRYQEASERYAVVLARQPDSLSVAARALGSFWRAARYDDAYVWGQRALAQGPASLDLLFDVGVTCGFLIALDCVESTFHRALAIDSTYVYGYGELAFLAQARGHPAEAVRQMEAAYAVAPENDFAVSGLAQMLIPAGQAARAKALMEPRLAANRRARAYGGRSMLTIYGWALLEMGDTAAANAAFEEVLGWLREREAAGQTTYQLYRERAAIHALQGDAEAAVQAMQTAFDRGWRLYGSWSLPDPMFRPVMDHPATQVLLERMRMDVRRMRRQAGLEGDG